MAAKKKILCIAYGGGHVNMIVPVARALRSRSEYDVTVLGLTTAGAVFEREGIPHIGFRDLVRDGDAPALEMGERLAEGLSNPAVPHAETVAYLGLSYWDLVRKHGETEAAKLYEEKSRRAFLPTTVFERWYQEVQPDLVVATNSPRAERAALTTASRMGIPSVCIVDSFALIEYEWIRENSYATKVCVWLDSIKDFLVEKGRNPEDILITGNPAYDFLAGENLAPQAEELRKQKGWNERKVILWASQFLPAVHPRTGKQGDPDLPRKVDSTLFDMLERHPDWQLVLRLHPSETRPLASLPDRAEFSPLTDDLNVLLKATDAVVSFTSTVGVKGMLLGVPFITLDFSVYADDAPFSQLGLARGVNKLDDLEPVLAEVLAEQWKPSVSLPHFGCATENIMDVIASLLAGKNG
ncbi:putative UDP-Glycosyltransferase/glycogen phosphorylase [Nitrospina gracilis 3/211]|uniref:Putative UDP-Glycosyltransferase/glycogen phosphorylase n=1 Tax=Nitrospina gracilis (strain 3/211) TaxID=1266370 RepID=M1YVV6_NITG3|nr:MULTISPECIES: hypothetical protein [Nitrospina]MCF8722800.1 hypothetical protein [Nitrospina sp. Nb-3]CCQ89754.1 putative UDP-Glycosyltransferase/glycogen phosphorylase [Nitrospina gracilis 3/211]